MKFVRKKASLEVHNVDWEKARSGIYASIVTRNQQDTHFLFVHIALYTDLVTSKFTEKKKLKDRKSKIKNSKSSNKSTQDEQTKDSIFCR